MLLFLIILIFLFTRFTVKLYVFYFSLMKNNVFCSEKKLSFFSMNDGFLESCIFLNCGDLKWIFVALTFVYVVVAIEFKFK